MESLEFLLNEERTAEERRQGRQFEKQRKDIALWREGILKGIAGGADVGEYPLEKLLNFLQVAKESKMVAQGWLTTEKLALQHLRLRLEVGDGRTAHNDALRDKIAQTCLSIQQLETVLGEVAADEDVFEQTLEEILNPPRSPTLADLQPKDASVDDFDWDAWQDETPSNSSGLSRPGSNRPVPDRSLDLYRGTNTTTSSSSSARPMPSTSKVSFHSTAQTVDFLQVGTVIGAAEDNIHFCVRLGDGATHEFAPTEPSSLSQTLLGRRVLVFVSPIGNATLLCAPDSRTPLVLDLALSSSNTERLYFAAIARPTFRHPKSADELRFYATSCLSPGSEATGASPLFEDDVGEEWLEKLSDAPYRLACVPYGSLFLDKHCSRYCGLRLPVRGKPPYIPARSWSPHDTGTSFWKAVESKPAATNHNATTRTIPFDPHADKQELPFPVRFKLARVSRWSPKSGTIELDLGSHLVQVDSPKRPPSVGQVVLFWEGANDQSAVVLDSDGMPVVLRDVKHRVGQFVWTPSSLRIIDRATDVTRRQFDAIKVCYGEIDDRRCVLACIAPVAERKWEPLKGWTVDGAMTLLSTQQ